MSKRVTFRPRLRPWEIAAYSFIAGAASGVSIFAALAIYMIGG